MQNSPFPLYHDVSMTRLLNLAIYTSIHWSPDYDHLRATKALWSYRIILNVVYEIQSLHLATSTHPIQKESKALDGTHGSTDTYTHKCIQAPT